MDANATVSSIAVAAMIFTLVVSIGVPIVLMIVWKVKTKASLVPFVIGAGTFIVFALILESIMHQIVLGATGDSITGNVWLYALYGGLAAGVFEETGRLVSMKFLMKKSLSKENGIMYGIGHGGIEAIIIIGLSYISNLAMTFVINSGMVDTIKTGIPEADQAVMQAVDALVTTPAWQFACAGIERVSAITLHICLSYFVYRAVKDSKWIYYILAVAIHAFVDAGTVLLLGTSAGVLLVEVLLIVFDVILVVIVVRIYRAEKVISPEGSPYDIIEGISEETLQNGKENIDADNSEE